MREGSDRRAKGSGEAKVSNLEAPISRNKEVLRFEIPMHDSTRMAEGESAADLVEIRAHQRRVEQPTAALHVLLEVLLEELKDQVKSSVLLHAVLEVNDVLVGQLAQQADLAQRRRRNALVLDLQADALQRHNLVVLHISRLVHHSVRALSQVGPRFLNFHVAA